MIWGQVSHMDNALLAAGIIPKKEYIGLVEFYDPYFENDKGRGRIRAYLGKACKDEFPYKTLEVFEEGITKGLYKENDKYVLKEDEIVRFTITIGKWGFTAINVEGMCMSSGMLDWKEFLPRLDSNKEYYAPLNARVRYPESPRMTMMPYDPADFHHSDHSVIDGNYRSYPAEEIPKIVRVSQEEKNEQAKT